MRKLVTLTLAVLMVGLFAAVVYAAVDAGDNSSSTVGTTETSPTTDTTETTTTPDDDGTADRGRGQVPTPGAGAPQSGVDISGPCDEAEHANDPRCGGGQVGEQGQVERNDDDGRGRHGDGEHGDDRGDDDNSGPGSVDDDGGHSGSGHGGGDDSGGDDGGNSGRGGGDDG